MSDPSLIRWFEDLTNQDASSVGGKNASLGEMIRTLEPEGIRVPAGFATTAEAYRRYLNENELDDDIAGLLADYEAGERSLQEVGEAVRTLIREASFPEEIAEAIRASYRELGERYGREEVDVAVRSSATAEDLPEASFAGQQESFLNVRGEEALLEACRRCYASLFTDRAISYREAQGFDHLEVALSVGVQKMVRSDKAGAGVLFTIDTETGFPDALLINAAWGLGEAVVKGTVNPDQYTVFKPFLEDESLRPIIGKEIGDKAHKIIYAEEGQAATRSVATTDAERRSPVLAEEEILQLARWGARIEDHYDRPMDVEWAKDGESGELFIVQARPETVQSRREPKAMKTYRLTESGEKLVTGLSIGDAVASGRVARIDDPAERDRMEDGAVLVTDMTDPDWVPVMKRAAAIVTDHGGRTSHAAIVSRELGVPAVVGTGDATELLDDGREVTVSCAEGEEGYVYDGLLEFEAEEIDLTHLEETETRIMINIASPVGALRWWRLPCQGVGLARMEYIINHVIKVHPMALLRPERVEDEGTRRHIEQLTAAYEEPAEYFVDHLARGIGTIAASQHPEPVVVRMSDFKTNEYADLIGGRAFEPAESNPMLGWRGASRYYSEGYRDGFGLECRAIRRVREEMGFENVIVMIPFCRSPEEADRVLEVMAEEGLERGRNGLEIYVMAEIPANITLTEAFADRFDGFSVGSNDLTQLVLGIDRDSEELAYLFDERNEAVTRTIAELIERAHAVGTPVGICGQAPSDYPEFAAFLVEHGIDSISLNPDSVPAVIGSVAEAESRRAESVQAAQ